MAKHERNKEKQERPRKPSRPRQSDSGSGRAPGAESGSITEREERNPGSEDGEHEPAGTPRRGQDE